MAIIELLRKLNAPQHTPSHVTMALLDETATVDLSKLYFGEPTKLKNGQMVIPVSLEAGKFGWDNRLEFQFGTQKQMVHSQYGLNKPQERADPNRRNLDFTPTPEMEKHLRACDAAVVKYCSENCETLFKTKTLNKQFCPIVQDKDKGTIVRVKVVSGGEGQLTEIRCFTPDCKGIFPGDINHLTRNLDLIVITSSLGVWYNSSQFGISLKAESILAKPSGSSAGGVARFKGLDLDVVEMTAAPEGSMPPAAEGE